MVESVAIAGESAAGGGGCSDGEGRGPGAGGRLLCPAGGVGRWGCSQCNFTNGAF